MHSIESILSIPTFESRVIVASVLNNEHPQYTPNLNVALTSFGASPGTFHIKLSIIIPADWRTLAESTD